MTLAKDADGRLFYLLRFTNTSYTRTVLMMTPDEGMTSYFVADRGASSGYATALIRKGNYLFCEGQRYEVSELAVIE